MPSSRTTTGTLTPTSLTAWMMPSAIRSQRTIPPEYIDQHCAHLVVGKDQLKRLRHPCRGGTAPTSRKVGRGAAMQLHQIHRRHRQACPVDHATNVAIQRDVVQIMFLSRRLARIFFWVTSRIATSSGLTEKALLSKLILASSAIRSFLLCHHQRIDLDQTRIAGDEQVIEALHEMLKAADLATLQIQTKGEFAALITLQTGCRIDRRSS